MKRGKIDLIGGILEPFPMNLSLHLRRRIGLKSAGGSVEKGKQGENTFPQTMGNDAMSKALHQISKSPFVRRIDRAKLPHRFSLPTFTIYNGRTDPVEHVSHFN